MRGHRPGIDPRPTPRLLRVVTAAETARAFLLGQSAYLADAGWDVHVAADEAVPTEDPRVRSHAVPLTRELSPSRDLRGLLALVRLVAALSPDLLEVSTPKAGLLGGLAGAALRVPRRVYLLRGLRLEGARGPRRLLLWVLELLACRCAHVVVCVSPSLRDRALRLHLVAPGRAVVLGAGSSNGVESARFRWDRGRREAARVAMRHAGVPEGAQVVAFVGRLVPDKGLPELLDAAARVRAVRPRTHLLLLGREEAHDPLPEYARHALGAAHVTAVGPADPALFLPAVDVLALPTHREGLPNVVLEAAAAGVPSVTTRATGAVDAVVDGVTGLLVPVGSSEDLAQALVTLLDDHLARRRMGEAARDRVLRLFDRESVWSRTACFYGSLIDGPHEDAARAVRGAVGRAA